MNCYAQKVPLPFPFEEWGGDWNETSYLSKGLPGISQPSSWKQAIQGLLGLGEILQIGNCISSNQVTIISSLSIEWLFKKIIVQLQLSPFFHHGFQMWVFAKILGAAFL